AVLAYAGAVLSHGLGRAHGVHRHGGLDRSGEPRLLDRAHQPRPPERRRRRGHPRPARPDRRDGGHGALRRHAAVGVLAGRRGDATTDVPHGRDPATGRPIWSLYGPARRPSREMLKDVSLLVFDIQDVGVRYYTYLTTLVYVMEEAARAGIPVVVLDRPNPITGSIVEGPVMDPDLQSFTGPHTIPVRLGLTIGEFARMAAAERKIPVSLTVVPLAGWGRRLWYDQTGLPWVNPSPNIRSLTEALLYSGVGLLEATNLSVGRGTDTPFEVVGAPWIEPQGLVD